MNALALFEQAQFEGVTLALVDGRLTWSADHEPPAALLNNIKNNRLEIIEALRAANDSVALEHSQQWLATVAKLLHCSPDYLLQHGFVDRHDLTEQVNVKPRLAVNLIRSHPDWQSRPLDDPASQDRDFCEQYAHAHEADRFLSHPPAAWLNARNSFYSHALGNCPNCYPPLGRYCSTGQQLRTDYMELTP